MRYSRPPAASFLSAAAVAVFACAVPAAAEQRGPSVLPGDLLHVQVYDNPDLDLDVRVPLSGVVTCPLIGDVRGVTTRSVEDIAGEIGRRLREGKFLRDPQVTVTVREAGARPAFVLGAVRTPGVVELGTVLNVTALQAVSRCGGFADDADRQSAVVVRDDPEAPGGKRALPLPNDDRLEDISRDIVLRPGDMLVVPRLDRVYVGGLVARPGAIPLPGRGRLTLSQALTLAGGTDRSADPTAVALLRRGQSRIVNLRQAGTEGDPILEPGDSVIVREFSPRQVFILGAVRTPGGVELFPSVTTTAMQAIGQVGGFAEDADRASARVVRDDPQSPGSKTILQLPSDDGAAALAKDVQLRPGDLVIVPRLERVYIIGQVIRPGAINLPGQGALTLSKAIALAGGFDRFARQDHVVLMRSGARPRTVDVREILEGGKTEDPTLGPGDTVMVPASRL